MVGEKKWTMRKNYALVVLLEVLLEKSNFCKIFKDEQNPYAKIGVIGNTPSLASRNVVSVGRSRRVWSSSVVGLSRHFAEVRGAPSVASAVT